MTKEVLGNVTGDFTWDFGMEFFIETIFGNFIWSDPDYGGSGVIKSTPLTYKQWVRPTGVGRDKGIHHIKDYCGDFTYEEA